ncbi:MAG: nickel-dependent lactate racemase [Synergistaceae bacterium]|nr:nickel-dependent lactate racemase [Synergistaceae bacterium]
MSKYSLKFDREKIDLDIPEDNLLGVLKSREVPCAATEEEAVRKALENPIGSPGIGGRVKPGEKVCIVTCDLTRAWQRTHAYLYLLVEEIKKGGAKDQDIFFLSGTGTHREQTAAEHKALLGEELYARHKIYDHRCGIDEMADFGTTSYGTPIRFNKKAAEADHLILTGGIVYHFMAGWSGGRKAVLPGIAAYETIMANHVLALNPPPGKGRNPVCRSGNVEGNPIHLDMVEAVSKLNPAFLLNVVMNAQGKIGWAFAGDWQKAHAPARDAVDSVDAIEIPEKADLVVASACGFPKDINFYQTSKTIFNAEEAVKPGGAILILSACSEGFGDEEVQTMLMNFKNSDDRETELRREFSIAKHVGYCIGETAKYCDFHLVTKMEPDLLKGTGINVSQTVKEALDKVYAKHGRSLSTWLMPQGANTLPKISV